MKLEEENNKKLNLKKILTEAITASIIIIICTIVIGAIVIVVAPNIEFKSNNKLKNDNNVDNALSKIREAMVKIYTSYIDDIDFDKMVEGAISGIASSTGDPYTRYLNEEEYQDLLTGGNEQYVGIGVHLSYDLEKDGIKILGVMPSSPALEAGIKPGDIIYYIEGTRVTVENYLDSIDLIKSEEGTVVNLVVGRNKELLEFNIVRKRIQANNISSDIIDDNIGYIKIWQFENGIYDQFKKEYDSLMNKNVRGLVIDLRNNPGGLVDQTLKIVNLMAPAMDALKLVEKDGKEKVFKTTEYPEINIPLAILVNENSASASEILSGIIKDSKKGEIVGTKTYGKGIVQYTNKLSFGGALSITGAKYYTPSGIEIHKNGIEPTIYVEQSEEYKNETIVPYEEDLQLKKALEYINSKK